MERTLTALFALPALALLTANAMAEEYGFEIDLAYDKTSFDGAQTITTPVGSIFSSNEIDTDDVNLLGSWYFVGLSDDKGPRARAVLVDRASSLSFAYSRTEQTIATILTSDGPSLPLPPVDSQIESKGNSFAVDFRYVDRDSGWFGRAGLLSSDIRFAGSVSDSFDASGWRLGVGKYLFETTTLGIDYSQVELDGGVDAKALLVSLEHLGSLGERWEYAIDVDYNRSDVDSGTDLDTWGAAVALYPTRDIEFGLAWEEVSADLAFADRSSLRVFGSWFVKPNVRLFARYQVDDVGAFGNVSIGGASTVGDTDQYSFGLGASIRF